MMKKVSGFTLVELLVSIMISSILITCTISIYSIFKKSMIRDQQKIEISQNARIALDRLSRELRQANSVLTDFPTDASDQSVAQPSEVEFADGHSNDLSYKRYYLSSSTLKLDTEEYYFSYDPDFRVRFNDIGTSGEAPIKRVVETQDIAENIHELKFYEPGGVEIQITTFDGSGQEYDLQTLVDLKNI